MENDLYHSHDKLFRETWSNRSNVQSFLTHYLPQDLLSIVHLDSLETCKDTFIEKDLKDYYSDMLYRIGLGSETGYIYFLFEHKSYPEKLIHIQLLEYMIKIWQLELKQSNNKKLAVVIPLVLYHGRNKWQVDESFTSVFNPLPDAVKAFVPNFNYILYDLSRYTDNQIKGTVTARVAMLLLKHIFDSNFVDKLPGILELMKNLSEKETGLQYFESLIKYVFSNVEDITTEQFQSIVSHTLSKKKGDIIMTLAERLKNEGLQKGLEQGLEQGMVKGLEKGLLEGIEFAVSIKFGDSDESRLVLAKIKSIKDINRLKALKGKIKSAATIPELIDSIEN